MYLGKSHVVMGILGVVTATILISFTHSVQAGLKTGLAFAVVSVAYFEKFGFPEPV
jgi:hypothetical protein